ncbi:hypothetical protein BC939DRAFT_333326 [Gamsiella multidivaricata]|uniref:uncharacterized protein n=1 Tax=Gamsiella multidivaricata TaxID=101098 RepID=UPI00221FD02D|nr:uncharacterized protein BC939DRAFT_333326 [Gamsiella multidivaricata]KAI7817323.1 hypothetical protein BC939DRAFT_333326 [Gamsiella multidivaricata]
MLFYTQNKTGAGRSTTPNGTSLANGTNAKGMPNGLKSAPVQMKRPRIDEDEIGDRVDRSSIIPKEKRAKIDEISELSKEERLRLKKERKRAKKLENLKAVKSGQSDYDLATAPLPSSSSSSTPSSSTLKLLFGAPLSNGPAPSKSLSPLADLDTILNQPPLLSSKPKPSTIAIPTRPHSDWTVTDGAMKSPVAEELRQLKMNEQRKKDERQDRNDDKDSSDEMEQDGWTVKPRAVSQVIVVSHDESSISKREKLQALIAREAESNSANAKGAMLDEIKHMLGSKVSTWEDTSQEVTKSRDQILRTLKPKHHRPDAYDVEYDRGKVKKVKNKQLVNGTAIGAKVANKFQSEQDVRNLVKVRPILSWCSNVASYVLDEESL